MKRLGISGDEPFAHLVEQMQDCGLDAWIWLHADLG